MKLSIACREKAPLRLDACTAADLMVPNPLSLRAEASVTEAMTLFTEKGITAAPVIDDAGRPLGVVSHSDLMIHQCEKAKHRAVHPEYFSEPTLAGDRARGAGNPPSIVAELMTPAVFAVSPDTPVKRVVHDMIGLKVHRIFVLDEDGILVGVISTMDVLRHLKTNK